jgi:hypothetical protein
MAIAKTFADKYKMPLVDLREKNSKEAAEVKHNVQLPSPGNEQYPATQHSCPPPRHSPIWPPTAGFPPPGLNLSHSDCLSDINYLGLPSSLSPANKQLYAMHMIFMFSQDTSKLNQINTLATIQINLSDTSDVHLIPNLVNADLAVLDPITLDKIQVVAHELYLTDLNLLETHEKLEMMEQGARPICGQSYSYQVRTASDQTPPRQPKSQVPHF